MDAQPTTEAEARRERTRSADHPLKGGGCLLLWVAFVVVGGSALALMWAPNDLVWYRERRDEQLFRAAKEASAALVEFQRSQGRLPASLSEAPEVEAAAARVVSECEGLGAKGAAAELARPVGRTEKAPPPVLLVRDSTGRTLVAIAAEGQVGIASFLMTRRANRVPDWIEILR